MYGREELKVYNVMCTADLNYNVGNTDEFGIEDFESYDASEADSVMDVYEARIKELEMERDNAMQLEQEWKETSDNNHKAYVDYFHLCEKQSERIKELEAQLENVQNTMYTENVDANMALVKANARIKELEATISKMENDQKENG